MQIHTLTHALMQNQLYDKAMTRTRILLQIKLEASFFPLFYRGLPVGFPLFGCDGDRGLVSARGQDRVGNHQQGTRRVLGLDFLTAPLDLGGRWAQKAGQPPTALDLLQAGGAGQP